MIERILTQMGVPEKSFSVAPFLREEDGETYDVWRVECPDKTYVLKKAKGQEASIYRNLLTENCGFAPKIYGQTTVDGAEYLLMEHIPGESLLKCTRSDLVKALDCMIRMQQTYWNGEDPMDSFRTALKSRINRGNFLQDQRLEGVYQAYLDAFQRLTRTLCHDDLLPFNVIVSEDRAVFIDWEVAGMLPYPTSLARLIAHCEEDPSAFFYMKEEDKAFAVDYYYERLVKNKGIGYDDFRRSLDLCLFYEYCEWIYVGNKYNTANSELFKKYTVLAGNMAEKLI